MTQYIHPQELENMLMHIAYMSVDIDADYTSTWKDMPEWGQQIVGEVFATRKYRNDKRPSLRSDMMPDNYWADVHKLYRSASAGLLERVQQASAASPDNQHIALLSAISQDIYDAAEDALKTSQSEKRSKRQNAQNKDGTAGADRPTEVPQKLGILKAKLLSEYDQYKSRAQNIAPDLTDAEIEAATNLARRVALYSFVGKYGFFRLPEKSLKEVLQQGGVSALNGAGQDLGQICTDLAAPPYEIEYGLPKEKIVKVIKHNIGKLQAWGLAESLRADGNRSNAKTILCMQTELGKICGPEEYTDARNLALIMAALATRVNDGAEKARISALATQVAGARNKSDLQALLTGQAYGDATDTLKMSMTNPSVAYADLTEEAGKAMRILVSAIEVPEVVKSGKMKVAKQPSQSGKGRA
ncbi:MAG TPA: hypothetical protein VFT64_07545 [Rickettsiales bacterium]|nr:hypothetical protein [Rickettsiales bacterium]